MTFKLHVNFLLFSDVRFRYSGRLSENANQLAGIIVDFIYYRAYMVLLVA